MAPVIGLVIALPAEAAWITGRKVWQWGRRFSCRHHLPRGGVELAVRISGTGPARGRLAARRLIKEGAVALVHLGVSGGLDPQLLPGHLVIADQVLAVEHDRIGSRWRLDAGLAHLAGNQLAARRLAATTGSILSSPRPLLSAAAKRDCGETFQALAVDMESAGVAMAAGECGIPCFILRSVCDTADQSVPPWLFHALHPDGSLRLARLTGTLVCRPAALAELLGLRRRFGTACQALHDALDLLLRSDFPTLLADVARIEPVSAHR